MNDTLLHTWWLLALRGAAAAAFGALAIGWPAITLATLAALFAAFALLAGAASVLFGLAVLLFPLGAGALALAWMIGLYALATGVMLLTLAFQVRAWSRLRSGPAGAV